MRHTLTLLRRVLTLVAVVCLGSWLSVKLFAYAATVHNEAVLQRLVAKRRGAPGPFPPADGSAKAAPPAEATLLGRIDIPTVGVSAVILQGVSERCLEQAAGHIPSTAMPDASGNAVIAGHRDSVFRNLQEIRLGDAIEVTTPDVTRRYRVDGIRIVRPTDTAVLAPATSPRLTLVTCYPFHYIGPAPDRFVVQARAVWSGAGAAVAASQPRASRRPATRTARRRRPVAHATRRSQARGSDRPSPTSPRPLDRYEHRPLQGPAAGAAHKPKVSWLRRLFHLGPARTPRR